MLNKLSSPYGVYGFRFFEAAPAPRYGLYAVGYEKVDSPAYERDGRIRKDGPLFLFQYTVSGRGVLETGGSTYQAEADSAFLLEIPGEFRFYPSLAGTGEPWVYYFILFQPDGLKSEWSAIKERLGSFTVLPPQEPAVEQLKAIYHHTRNGQIADAYQASAALYRFIMELSRFGASLHPAETEWPDPIRQTAEWMREHLATLQNLDDICRYAGLSKYHFIRRFSQATGYSPIQYLTKLRIERSIELLRETDANVDEIARAVGFTGGSYFSKVFRDWVGCPPGEFRTGKSHLTFSSMIFH